MNVYYSSLEARGYVSQGVLAHCHDTAKIHEACQAAYRKDKWILALTQREETDLEPDINQLYEVGTLCSMIDCTITSRRNECIIEGIKGSTKRFLLALYEGRTEPYGEDNSMDQKSFADYGG